MPETGVCWKSEYAGTGGGETSVTAIHRPAADDQWEAIVRNDADFDGQFFYAVTTTGIFCRPSCASKLPRREHVILFPTAEEALAAQFRPCKRCGPTEPQGPREQWIGLVADYVDRNIRTKLTLDQLAAACHGTPHHLHRTFRQVMGVTPLAYVRARRIDLAKALLTASDDPVAAVGDGVGLSNTPYFVALFKQMTGHTPADYRQTFRGSPEIPTRSQEGNPKKGHSKKGHPTEEHPMEVR